jgi:uncharacterized membrane-anchored protein YhcB (DUF1043 family)
MNRSWLRFSIRDVLWLTLVVGMAVGWLADRLNQSEIRRASEQIWIDKAIKAEMEKNEVLYGKLPPAD